MISKKNRIILKDYLQNAGTGGNGSGQS